jgi:L-ascorbate metabolism protein UlaG (beta-lactamase superfamily)
VVPRPRLDVRFLGHATLQLDLGGIRVLTDPFLRSSLGPLERHGPPPDPRALEDIDVVVISHAHADHFDPASLATLEGRPLVVVPRGLGRLAQRSARGDVVEVSAGDRVSFGALTIAAVPARHWMSPRGPRAQPVGYLLEGEARVYFAGDTGPFDEMRMLAGNLDLALLPVWTWGPHLGPGHLGPRAAAEVLRDISPAVAVPIHWGTLYPRRLHRVWGAPLAEPGDRFASHAARLAPAVDVRVLRPGDSTSIELVGRASPRPEMIVDP